MKTKFNAYEHTLYSFINDIFVVCPNCTKQAIVITKGFLKEKDEKEIKLICSKCGLSKYYSETPNDKFLSDAGTNYVSRFLVLGTNIDPYFKHPLWLQKELRFGVLWAYNYEHLDFLKNHINAELRFRNPLTNHNRSLGARLPRWMTSKKNREEILAEIEKLKAK